MQTCTNEISLLQVVRRFDDSAILIDYHELSNRWPFDPLALSKPSLSRPLVLKRFVFFCAFEVDLPCKGGKTALMIACTLGREAVVAEARLQRQNSN